MDIALDEIKCKVLDNQYVVTSCILGQGSFAKVYKGYYLNNPSKLIAVKVIPIQKISHNKEFIKLLIDELKVASKLKNNKHIVTIYDALKTQNNIYIFQQFCNDGDLNKLLNQRPEQRFSEPEAICYMQQLVEGIKCLYQNSIVHRDIKPANILVDENKVLIGDFGFSKIYNHQESSTEQGNFKSPLGTPYYKSPQILEQKQYSNKCDIWSLGILFYQMLFGQMPWKAQNEVQLLDSIKRKPLAIPNTPLISIQCKELIKRMITINEEERISWEEIFSHDLLIKANIQHILQQIDYIEKQETKEQNINKAFKINNFYVNSTKYMNLDKCCMHLIFEKSHQCQDEEQQQVHSPQDSNQSKMLQNQDWVLINDQHKQTLVKRKNIKQLDSFIIYQRNIQMFKNSICNQLFILYQNKQLLIGLKNEQDQEKLNINIIAIIVVLLKQNLIQNILISQFLEQKEKKFFQFNSNDVEQFKQFQPKEYQCTQKVIECDFKFSQNLYNEIYKLYQEKLNYHNKLKNEQQQKKLIEYDLNFLQDSSDISNQLIIDFLNYTKDSCLEKKYINNIDILHIIYDLFVILKINEIFNWQNQQIISLYQWYDQQEKMSDYDLEKQIELFYNNLKQ